MVWHKLFGIGKLDGAAFTKLVARLGAARGHFEEPEIDPQAMRIKSGSTVMFLGNMHAQFLAIPRRQRLAYVRDVVLSADPEIPAAWTDAKPLLRTVVRDGAYLTMAHVQAQVARTGPPLRPRSARSLQDSTRPRSSTARPR